MNDIQILHDLSVAMARVMTDDKPNITRHISYIDENDTMTMPKEGKCYKVTVWCEIVDESERDQQP